MNKQEPLNQLLKDVFAEEGYAEFRSTLYQQSLAELRHQRKARIRTRALLGITCLLGASYLFLQFQPVHSPTNFAGTQKNVTLPLNQTSISSIALASQPLSKTQVVHTSRSHVDIITTSSQNIFLTATKPSVEIIRTNPALGPELITSDEELLAFFKGYPVELVATGPRSKRLIFLNPEDEKLFLEP